MEKKNPPPIQHLTPIVKGQVLNPNGMPKGYKHAKTIVREFMDKKITSLAGTKVSRFQYLLWSMYEINFQLMKQLEYRKEEVERAEKEFVRCKDMSFKKRSERAQEFRSRNRELEKVSQQVQDSQKNLSEFFLKASGQYSEKKEIEARSSQPLHITVSNEDLESAVGEINDEL